MIRRALELNVSCLVLCQAELPAELRSFPTSTCIISTPFDAYRAARLIFLSTPVGRICNTDGAVCFHLDDRVDDVRETVLKHRHPSYPIDVRETVLKHRHPSYPILDQQEKVVGILTRYHLLRPRILDQQEKVVGILTRYHLLRPRRKRVVLVDHNEASQSVPGLDEAEILEIIDHHRLADIQTNNPIYVRYEPVGSSNTIIASMFQEGGRMPSAALAGMMAAAILSDTVMFKSPTCTPRDIRTAERMARIANVSLDELGKEIFSASVQFCRTPLCSNPPPAPPGISAPPSGWRELPTCPWTSWARKFSPPALATKAQRKFCSPTTRNSTLPATLWLWPS